MKSELINIIENLNPRSFEDYKKLGFELRENLTQIIEKKQEDSKKDKDVSQENLRKDYLKQISINYIIDKFNVKLLQYVRIFFINDELIRNVLQKNISIEREIFDDIGGFGSVDYRYFYSISRFSEIKMDKITLDPHGLDEEKGMNIRLAMAYKREVEDKFKMKYYTQQRKQQSHKGSNSCFIATYAYDSCENENVTLYRNYRDLVLLDSLLGRWFIHQYYNFSPSIVKFFEKINFPKKLLRFPLNLFVKIIKKKLANNLTE
ncbi:CFI-box-CTERM domain-containing protein [Xanthomarina gelatinilytica]|uniref:CFI-box-CTERM domain-containing protein n=1 Tax=Xanthomarina gelatinilytica TaxID=1137281 RepID=UPI003AA893EC